MSKSVGGEQEWKLLDRSEPPEVRDLFFSFEDSMLLIYTSESS